MPNRQQAIIWTNADLIHWWIYVALWGDKLILQVDKVLKPVGLSHCSCLSFRIGHMFTFLVSFLYCFKSALMLLVLFPGIFWSWLPDGFNKESRPYTVTWRSCNLIFWHCLLTLWGRDKMTAILQTTLSKAFSWMKMLEFQLNFHWKFVLKGRVHNIPALVQIMPLYEPMMVSLLTHICVTWS